MLNCPITKDGSTELTERRFKDNRSQFDDNKLMRYRDEFNDPDEFLRLANETVPFLNGGLFDCLDEKRTGMYYDGFSERKESMAQLIVPDYLFFGEEAGKNIDLSEFYGDANKRKCQLVVSSTFSNATISQWRRICRLIRMCRLTRNCSVRCLRTY